MLILNLLSTGLGCAAMSEGDHESIGATNGDVAIGAAQQTAMLELLSFCATDLAFLDDTVALNARAAKRIVAYRNGPDGVYPSGDDNPIESLEELDAIKYVGEAALTTLRDYVIANPPPASELVEGVQLNGEQVLAVLWGVGQATVTELDKTVELNSKAAANLVAGAPYANVAAIGAVAYVGPSALSTLRSYAHVWVGQMSGHAATASYDGVSFDAATAATALEIANDASLQDLTTVGDLYSQGAKAIIAGRAHSTLADVAATSGVGPATMQALHDFAVSGLWSIENSCTLSATPTADKLVDDYQTALAAYDIYAPNYHRFEIATYEIPACNSIEDSATLDALTQLMIDHAGWGWVVSKFPQMLQYKAVYDGPGMFTWQLSKSINYAGDWSNDHIGYGEPNAQEDYDALEAMADQIKAEALADPEGTFSMHIHLSASECSQDVVLMFKAATGKVTVIHKDTDCY